MTWNTRVAMIAVLLPLVGVSPIHAEESAVSGVEFFEKQIRPLFAEHCSGCHGEKKQEGGLRLTSRDFMLKGGDSGAAIVPGKADSSLLIRAVDYLDELKMPPKKKLPDADIVRLKQWVAMGAPWPVAATKPSHSGDSAGPAPFEITPKQQGWWAYQPVREVLPPAVVDNAWPRGEIDRFVLAELESHGLVPTAVASRAAWLRRATFDLMGLPPTPEELDAFVTDGADDAYERVLDRLLGSPAYGQRWARHWLDIVRYADYHDADAKARNPVCEPLEAWRYRDWVVEALNRDLPYDQFVTHQIAGDLISADGKTPYPDGLIATTFLVNGAWDRGDADKEKMVSDMVDDQIDTVGKAFLGLTLGCARCHNHKFDPVSHADYYALAGIFYSTRMLKELGTKGGEITLQRRPLVPQDVVEQRDRHLRQIAEVNAKLAEIDKQVPKPPADDPVRLEMVGRRDQLQKELPAEPPMTLAVSEGGVPGGLFPGIQDVPIHIRGSYTRLGAVVPRRMPTFFVGDDQPPITSGSGRRELAAWVTSAKNPLTARVIVNRIWQWHFGQGLVRTSNNFGLLSEPPSHPALLDWLAARFVNDGWSFKSLHRRIMLSATYRQGAAGSPQHVEKDPDNRWLGRFTARRLEAESIRDALLLTSGRLEFTAGGPAGADIAQARRSLYLQTARWDRSNFAMLFDAANPDSSVESRAVSTVAPQALFLLNHAFSGEQARYLADRLARDVPDATLNAETLRIQRAYRLLLGRLPSTEELEIARQIVVQGGWVDLAHVLLCSNEFVYLD